MYLYHVLFTHINIYGIDCQKRKNGTLGDLVIPSSFATKSLTLHKKSITNL
jgi:hypothetical protein